MNMSIFSCDILNSFKMPTSSQAFNFKYQAPAVAAAVNAKTAEKSTKKRKTHLNMENSPSFLHSNTTNKPQMNHHLSLQLLPV